MTIKHTTHVRYKCKKVHFIEPLLTQMHTDPRFCFWFEALQCKQIPKSLTQTQHYRPHGLPYHCLYIPFRERSTAFILKKNKSNIVSTFINTFVVYLIYKVQRDIFLSLEVIKTSKNKNIFNQLLLKLVDIPNTLKTQAPYQFAIRIFLCLCKKSLFTVHSVIISLLDLRIRIIFIAIYYFLVGGIVDIVEIKYC